MEDVLEVYHQPVDNKRPVVCPDEFCKQSVSEKREPVQPQAKTEGRSGHPLRQDYEYVREGTASGFMLSIPHQGIRDVFTGKKGTRTALDYADTIEYLCDEMCADAEKIILVQDNLNTHNQASLYKQFTPEKAGRLIEKTEWHYTPEHGSWLNMAEIEISVPGRTGLSGRIPSFENFKSQVKTNIEVRNASPSPIAWTFNTDKARISLRKLYPNI